MAINILETLKKYLRVLQVARKPTGKNITDVLRIVGIGFIIIGILGFVFYLVSTIFGV